MTPRLLVGVFEREEDVCEATSAARREGLDVVDVFAPYAVHGLDRALGLRPSRLSWVCFLLGLFGAVAMLLFQYWASAVSWPINVGGKPWNSLPAFVPVTFEMMVLVAGLAALLGMLFLNGLPRPYHPVFNVPQFARASQDRFFLCIEATDPLFDKEATGKFLESLEPREVCEVAH